MQWDRCEHSHQIWHYLVKGHHVYSWTWNYITVQTCTVDSKLVNKECTWDLLELFFNVGLVFFTQAFLFQGKKRFCQRSAFSVGMLDILVDLLKLQECLPLMKYNVHGIVWRNRSASFSASMLKMGVYSTNVTTLWRKQLIV